MGRDCPITAPGRSSFNITVEIRIFDFLARIPEETAPHSTQLHLVHRLLECQQSSDSKEAAEEISFSEGVKYLIKI